MDSYSAAGTITNVTGAPGDSALGILASILTRAKIHLIIMAAGGTPADNVLQWLIRRFTNDGTATTVTPTLLDPDAPAAQLSGRSNYTAEPTVSTTIFDLPVHQRSSFTWNAAPGKELTIPAVASNGIAVTPIHASYTGTGTATAHWME